MSAAPALIYALAAAVLVVTTWWAVNNFLGHR
jgi:hypothetical protein